MQKQLGAAPANATDAATKGYADGLALVTASFSAAGVLVAATVGQFSWYNDTGRTLTFISARASVGTAPTGAPIVVDIDKNGTTIFTTQSHRPSIAATGTTNKVTVFDVTTINDGDVLTVDVDSVGSTIAGSNLVVTIWMK